MERLREIVPEPQRWFRATFMRVPTKRWSVYYKIR
ncbi:hypothetical protein ACVWXL_008814 [Bradyrhizobium sp. GM22.5]